MNSWLFKWRVGCLNTISPTYIDGKYTRPIGCGGHHPRSRISDPHSGAEFSWKLRHFSRFLKSMIMKFQYLIFK